MNEYSTNYTNLYHFLHALYKLTDLTAKVILYVDHVSKRALGINCNVYNLVSFLAVKICHSTVFISNLFSFQIN